MNRYWLVLALVMWTVTRSAFAASPDAKQEIDRLSKQVAEIHQRAEVRKTVTRLEAEVWANPKDAEMLAELAMLDESDFNFSRARHLWRQLLELGPTKAGALYEVADTKLKSVLATLDVKISDAPWQILTISEFLTQKGFDEVTLTAESLHPQNPIPMKMAGKYLIASVVIGTIKGKALIDTGAGPTVIARQLQPKLHLAETKTNHRIEGTLGSSATEFVSTGRIESFGFGKWVLHNLAVLIQEVPHVDALLGLEDLHRVGAIIDCGRQVLYTAPNGPQPDISEIARTMLISRGFMQVPMRLNSRRHLEVDAKVNSIPCDMIVDTGSMLIGIDKAIGLRAGVTMRQSNLVATAVGGKTEHLATGHVDEISIGDYSVKDVEAGFSDYTKAGYPSACFLDIGQLAANSAIIDVGGMQLYLRHPNQP
jgi:predicted aspartyl protease